MAEKVAKRVGDADRRKKAHAFLQEIGLRRSAHKICREKVDKLSDAWEMEKAKTAKASDALQDATNKLLGFQEEIDADYLPEGAQPPARIQKRDKQQMIVEQLQVALEAQKRGTDKAFNFVSEAERKLFEADRDLHKYVDSLEDTELATKVQAELDQERSQRLAALENERALRWEKEQKSAIAARAKQIEELTAHGRTQIEATRKGKLKASHSLRQAAEHRDKLVEEIQMVEDIEQKKREKAVLGLKHSIDKSRLQAAKDSDKHRKKIEKAKKELEDEKEILLAKGKNPYVEFRKREFAAEAREKETKLRQAVHNNKQALAEALVREEMGRFKEETMEAKAKNYEKKHRDEQGRHVTEDRVTDYIKSVVTGGHEVLDPTGRAPRVDPSQVTDIKDHSFGLGNSQRIPPESMSRITERIRQELKVDKDDLGEYQRLITGLLSAQEKKELEEKKKAKNKRPTSSTVSGVPKVPEMSEKELAELKKKANQEMEVERAAATLNEYAAEEGAMPGISNAAVTVNLDDDREEKAELLKLAAETSGGGANLADLVINEEPKYKLGETTKFEKNSLSNAMAMQRTRLVEGTQQVAGGRVFRGQAFIPKPAELLFKDFEVGKTYTKIFTLTNTSYTFNSFKILDLEDAVIDFFEITFDKPGRMSAGVSCPLEIKFFPKVNKDIFSYVNFYTETGPVAVPLRCLIKRCAPRIVNPHLDFDTSVIGEISTQSIKIENSQALPTAFRYYPVDENDKEIAVNPIISTDEGEDENEEVVAGAVEYSGESAENNIELTSRVKRFITAEFRRKEKTYPQPLAMVKPGGYVEGYGHTSTEVLCAPLYTGAQRQRFAIEFEQVKDADESYDSEGAMVKQIQYFDAQVTGLDLPIYIVDDVVDLRTCLYRRTYRKRFELRNRANITYKVNINIKAPFDKYVEVNPAMCFVQGHSSQFINIKYTPKDTMLQDLSHFCVMDETYIGSAFTQLPIEISVTGQQLPVYFVVNSFITPSIVNFDRKRIDYGKVYTNQELVQSVTLTNTSMLPQKVAFVKLKREVTISPNDGFGVLLPNETMDFQVHFCPTLPGQYDTDLIMQTSNNDKYIIKISANVEEPPFSFDNPVVVMRTTGPGERVLESMMVTNRTDKQQCMEIFAPHAKFSWIRISPKIIDLAPAASARVEIEYLPPKDALSLDPTEWHQACVDEATSAQQEGGEDKDEEAVPESSAVQVSPFEEWREEGGWVFGSGMFGNIQWVKAGAGTLAPKTECEGDGKENKEEPGEGEVDAAADTEGVTESKGDDTNETLEGKEEDKATSTAAAEKKEEKPLGSEPFVPSDLPKNEWGVSGTWNFPVLIKPPAARLGSRAASRASDNGAPAPVMPPMFLNVHTMVMLPQIESDIKDLDFGQLAMGTRELKTFKIINRSNVDISLKTTGINAVGPFQIIRPPKKLEPGEVRSVIIECMPRQPGLCIDMLELFSSEEIGGHRLRIQLKAQGLKPVISLEELSAPPPSWNSRCGLLEFGHCVAGDRMTKKFKVQNSSTFAVDVNILRAACKGLSPIMQAQYNERTAAGLPVISFRPEKVTIPQGASQDIEVVFHPDRGRLYPFREDLEIIVGETDEILKVGVVGRSWPRQVFVTTGNPQDEPFYKVSQPGGAGVAMPEDFMSSHLASKVREVSKGLRQKMQVPDVQMPPIKLVYPDPFDPQADPSTYTEGGAAAGGKGKGAPAGGAEGSRAQTRRIVVSGATIADGRAGAGNGTFELQPSPELTAAGLFSFSTDKGAANAGSDTNIDITCNLPKPKGIGGLSVGSWREFKMDVVVKGGWKADGASDEERIPVVLQCFVCL